MKFQFKLLNFFGQPVEISIWFLALFFILSSKTVIVLFLSVLIHEMSHVYTSEKLGYKTFGIKLDVLFGLAKIQSDITPKDNIKIVVAGPLSNLALFLIGLLLYDITPYSEFFSTLSMINLLMFFVNILPIFPLDGGRIVRDVLFLITDSKRSIRISAMSSLIFSVISLLFSVVNSLLVCALFALLFIYHSLIDLNIIKTDGDY